MEVTNSPALSVLIPCLNEAARLPETLAALRQTFPAAELIVCDDGSEDDTAAVAAACGARVVGYRKNRGKGHALRTAAAVSKGDILLLSDADLAYGTGPLAEAALLLEREEGLALVLGSRRLQSHADDRYPPLRKLASRGFALFQRLTLGLPMSDTQCGLKCVRGDIGRALFARCTVDGFAWDLEFLALALREHCRYREIPVALLRHDASRVHLLRDSLRMARETLRIRRRLRRMP
ncbi:MAG: glycosyltransferase [Clostridia bacterium]|nr:glycosyltransferase [Clostridia bacterium]